MVQVSSVHSTYLDDLVKDVADFGSTRIPYHQLYRWYDADRLTKRVWNDLIERFDELLARRGEGKDGYVLGYIDHNRNDYLTLVCLDAKAAKCGSDTLKPLAALV